jgi:hypothetical protein
MHKTDNQTYFILGTNSYIFDYQGSIFREFSENKKSYAKHVLNVLVTLTINLKMKGLKMLLINTLRMAPWCQNM